MECCPVLDDGSKMKQTKQTRPGAAVDDLLMIIVQQGPAEADNI